ncbi:hypothetical protein [Alkaliphilus pronyensis]|uniref:hypothetical protein n=1 Tax=Alkaliphilus pronyensis TaxID=1482732 RepID=UPI00186572D9|nr:hypothetical protein [Alkaliphilus pronyensis]
MTIFKKLVTSFLVIVFIMLAILTVTAINTNRIENLNNTIAVAKDEISFLIEKEVDH